MVKATSEMLIARWRLSNSEKEEIERGIEEN